jgi:serralysin
MCTVCTSLNPYLDGCRFHEFEATISQENAGNLATMNAVATGTEGPTAIEGADASNTIATTAQIEVSGFYMGSLDFSGDEDWISVELEAGQEYTIAVAGTGALGSSADDPTLRLRDSAGNVIETNFDGGPGSYAEITFTPTTAGTYYIEVEADSFSSSDTGTYGVSVSEGGRANFNADMIAGTLLRPDLSWNAAPGTGATVTWSILASGGDGNGFDPLTSAQVSAVEDAMAYLQAISGLTLNQVNPGGTSNNATIVVGAYSAFDGSGAYAYYPGNASSFSVAGDIWLNNNAVSTSNLGIGTYSYFTVLHEIGHAIGLAHPGDYNASPGQSITYNNDAQFVQDSHQYTVMSYFDETNTGASSGLGYPDTFMLYDILAIHQLYGANTSYNAGNTVYGFNATMQNTAYDFDFNATPFLSIYDGGGEDTVDLSGYTMAQYLDLNQGKFSNIGGYVGNMSIAFGAKIENGIGGSGDDTIRGNAEANALEGEGGDDELRGGDGVDTVFGGTGDDYLIGHNGWDELYGEDGNDELRGSSGADVLHGGADNDELHGGSGVDTLAGGAGNDTLWGNEGADILRGDDGNDELFGGTGDDELFGNAGNDVIEDLDTLEDRVQLDDALWAGTLTAQEILDMFGGPQGSDYVLDFGSGNTLTIQGGVTEAELAALIDII